MTGAQLARLMFPRFDAERRARAARQGHERLARRRRRQGGLRLPDRGRVGRARRRRDPGPPGDQPRRPARDGRGPRHPHQPRRQDLARRRGGPRHGPHLRLRRRGAAHRRRAEDAHHAGRHRVARATRSPSTAPPARCSPARCRSSTRWSSATSRATTTAGDELVAAVARVMEHADAARRLQSGPTPTPPSDAARARRFGAAGHRAVPHRAHVPRRAQAAGRGPDPGRVDEDAGEGARRRCCRCSATTSSEILEAMDGLPVTIRLIDPPLHEFLPDYTDLCVEVALDEERGEVDEQRQTLLEAVKRLHEQNPMLGLRGVRLGIVIPGLFAMQARAILEAAALRIKAGGDPQPGDHDPAGRDGAGAGDGPRRHHGRRAEDERRDRRRGPVQDRHHDRAAARRDDRRTRSRGRPSSSRSAPTT